jgi:antitoxin ChpS
VPNILSGTVEHTSTGLKRPTARHTVDLRAAKRAASERGDLRFGRHRSATDFVATRRLSGILSNVYHCFTSRLEGDKIWRFSARLGRVPTMQIILRKYGNSTVAVLPPAVLKDLSLTAGQAMTLDTTDQREIVLTPQKKYVLADLIAQCNPRAPEPADLTLWDAAKPAGKEVW